MLKGKVVTIGITGSIAAFKTPELVRLLQNKNAVVRTLITPQAQKFVSKTVLGSLTQNPVFEDEPQTISIEHIDLANSTDLFLLAPLTANTLSKISLGLADNLLTATILATHKAVLLCPAMNTGMWQNPLLQKNLVKLLKLENFTLIPPETGHLACGDEGAGRLAELSKIVFAAEKIFTPQLLEKKNVLISLGATREALDPVRFLSNRSSGKMGYALAETAALMGANVTVIAGHTDFQPDIPVKTIPAETNVAMLTAAENEIEKNDIFVSAAAVSDFYAETQTKKIPSGDTLKLKLFPTADILKILSKKKKAGQIIIGFALENTDLEKNAQKKLKQKKLDGIIANSLQNLGSAEGSCIFLTLTQQETFETQPKKDLAFKLWRKILELKTL